MVEGSALNGVVTSSASTALITASFRLASLLFLKEVVVRANDSRKAAR